MIDDYEDALDEIKRLEAEIERLRAENDDLALRADDWARVCGEERAEIERLRAALQTTWNALDTNQLDRAMGIIRDALAGKGEP